MIKGYFGMRQSGKSQQYGIIYINKLAVALYIWMFVYALLFLNKSFSNTVIVSCFELVYLLWFVPTIKLIEVI